MSNKRTVTFNLSDEVIKRLTEFKFKSGMSKSSVVEQALWFYIKKREEEGS